MKLLNYIWNISSVRKEKNKPSRKGLTPYEMAENTYGKYTNILKNIL
jgi:hypothetical protein